MRSILFVVTLALFAAAAVSFDADERTRDDAQRFVTTRSSKMRLPLPAETDAFSFVIFGDRTGGPAEGVQVLAAAVDEVNTIRPDLVMTVGDLVQGYNETPQWLLQATEYKTIMGRLKSPWFPVVGNHDIYWRGKGERPPEEHERDYEEHFGPLWYAFQHKTAWFIALDSDEADPNTGERNFNKPESQKISAEQFEFLRSTLERARNAEHVFVFLHHPRWLGGNYGDDWERVHTLLAAAGNVKAVFAGHIHRMRYDGRRDGIEYFALATVGGDQSGIVPRAGYLHQYHLVTVRKDELAVAAFPVGSAFDARAITGELSDDSAAAARGLAPKFDGAIRFDPNLAADGTVSIALQNSARRALDVQLTTNSRDARWTFEPEHAHAKIEAGKTRTFKFRASRPNGQLDAAFHPAEFTLAADYLGENLRVPLPERSFALPIDRSTLPLPEPAELEHVLTLDGRGDCLRVEHAELALPDGPFTVEGWLCADSFRERQGFINKTESCEFGLFVDDGVPAFIVHLNQRYVSARAERKLLEPQRWFHLAGVFDGAEVRLYVDGRQVAAERGAGARTIKTLPLLIGADVSGDGTSNSHFPGQIDEVRISSGARYAAQVAFEPQRRFESDPQTLLLLHMDRDLGPWAPDVSPERAHARRMGDARTVPLR